MHIEEFDLFFEDKKDPPDRKSGFKKNLLPPRPAQCTPVHPHERTKQPISPVNTDQPLQRLNNFYVYNHKCKNSTAFQL